MTQNLKSELTGVEDQEVNQKKNQLYSELYNGGPIQDFVVRKLRPAVELVLRNKDGEDFAQNNYGATCHFIIKAALVINKPALFSRVLTKDQVEKVEQTYTLQLQFVKSVIERIDRVKIFKQFQNLTLE